MPRADIECKSGEDDHDRRPPEPEANLQSGKTEAELYAHVFFVCTRTVERAWQAPPLEARPRSDYMIGGNARHKPRGTKTAAPTSLVPTRSIDCPTARVR